VFDDELPHGLVSVLDFFGVAAAEAVLSVRDRLEKKRNSVGP
jgi:hypothetical protein